MVQRSEGLPIEGFQTGDFGNATTNVELLVTEGEFGRFVQIKGGTAQIDGGIFGDFFSFGAQGRPASGSVNSGSFGSGFRVNDGSDVEIAGGSFGHGFAAWPGSDVMLVGADFQLNGVEYTETELTLSFDDVFSGRLADGSHFVVARNIGDRLDQVTLQSVTLPDLDHTPIIIDNSNLVAPRGLGSGQTLTLREGGKLHRNFAAIDATLTVEGGMFGDSLEAVNSQVEISDGQFGAGFHALAGSTVSISGGNFGEGLSALHGSTMSISGGVMGDSFRAASGSDVELIGGEFKLNGEPYTQNEILIGQYPFGFEVPTDYYTGRLADGSPFIFSPQSGDELRSVRLVETALPSIDTTPVTVEAGTGPAPLGLVAGQSLTLRDGGVIDKSFVVVDATLEIEGGVVGDGLEAANATITVTGGTIGGGFRMFSGTTASISGGTFIGAVYAEQGSTLRIAGGAFESQSILVSSVVEAESASVSISGGRVEELDVYDSVVEMTGGVVGLFNMLDSSTVTILDGSVNGISVVDESVLNIAGGMHGDLDEGLHVPVNRRGIAARSPVNISGGLFSEMEIDLATSPNVTFLGTEFVVDGQLLEMSFGETRMVHAPDLSGTLADGSPFTFIGPDRNFYTSNGGYVSVTRIPLTGDLNLDGVVDVADYTVWRNGLGANGLTPFTGGDGDGDGRVTHADYLVWRNSYSTVAGSSSRATAVPEPNTAVCCVGLVIFVASRRKRLI